MSFNKTKPLLFITSSVPSVKAAGDKYTMLLLEDLAKYQEVHLIYFYNSGSSIYLPPPNVKVLASIEVKTIDKVLSILANIRDFPLFSVRYNHKYRNFIKGIIGKNEYKAVFLNYSQVFKYGTMFNNIPIFCLSHDIIYQRTFRQNALFMTKWAYSTEKRILNSFESTIFTFSHKDCKLLKELYSISSYPTNFYLDDNTLKATPSEGKFDYFVLFGAWNRKENTYGLKWFFEHVYVKLSSKPNIKIIGGKLNEDIVRNLSKYKEVEYLGFVDDPYPIIANAKAVLAPLFHGAGVKVKVIESLACGTPVIGSDVAFEGISLKYSEFMFVANDASTYIRIIESINLNLDERMKMKKCFISHYVSESIPQYIKEYCQTAEIQY